MATNIPAPPARNEDPWFDKRDAFDQAVRTRLNTELSDAALSATIGDRIPAAVVAAVTGSSDLADDYTYAREDIKVTVFGQHPDGTLIGSSWDNGHFVTSTDHGDTWTDRTYSPSSVSPGITEVIFIGAFMFGASATTGKVWRAPAYTFNGWVEITPSDTPAGTTARPSVLATDGTRLLYGNYNAASNLTEHARVWRCTNPTATTPTWALALDAPTARHVHAVVADPREPGTWWVTLGDDAQPGNGLYRSTDNGATFTRVSANRYPINLAFPPTLATDGNTPSWVIGEGDGPNEPHLFAFRRALLPAGGPQEGLGWPAPGFEGTTRGLHIDSNGDAFYVTTAEGGAVGTKDYIWAARGPFYASPVVLEELSAPWPAYLNTYESGDYLFNFRYRIRKPKWKPRSVTKAAPTHAAPGVAREGMQIPLPARVSSSSPPHEYPLGSTSGLVSGGSWPSEGLLTTERTLVRATQRLQSVATTTDAAPFVWVRSTFRPAAADPQWGAWRLMSVGMFGAYVSIAAQSIPNTAQTVLALSAVRHQGPGTWLSAGTFVVPAKCGGYYNIGAQIGWDVAASAAGRREITVRRNGTPIVLGRSPGSTELVTTACATTQLLAEGDVIDVQAFQTSGAAISARAGGLETFLDVRRVAA